MYVESSSIVTTSEIESTETQRTRLFLWFKKEDPTSIIENFDLFKNTMGMSARIIHTQTVEECVEAWRSHGILHTSKRKVWYTNDIESLLKSKPATIEIPYTTNM